MTLPQVLAFPASFNIEEGCGGSYAIGRGRGCPSAISFGSLANTWSDSGTATGTIACGAWAPPGSVDWSVDWTASITSIGDNGDGTWRYQVHLTADPTNCTISDLRMCFTVAGAEYADGDYVDSPYLSTVDLATYGGQIRFTVTVACAGGSPTAAVARDLTGDFTPYGFYFWDSYYDFATMVLGGNDRFELGSDCALSTYALPPSSAGAVDARRVEWQVRVIGATPYTYLDVYFHIESRTIGSGSWTETTQIDAGGDADGDGNYLSPWMWVNLVPGYEYRLKVGNEIDFTDFFGGPPPGP